MQWPRLIEGVLIKRYKRFLFDVRLKNGRTVTAHCPNTGSMTGCCEPGCAVYLSRSDNPHRLLPYTVELTRMNGTLVGVNTLVPNRLVKESVMAGRIPQLSGYPTLRSEVRYGSDSRIDLLLENGNEQCYVEIKNCTLVVDGTAFFPDAVSSRGQKHLKELERQVQAGSRCVMFYLVQRMDAGEFRPADHIDPAYGMALRSANSKGVELLAYDVTIDLENVKLNKILPYFLS
jgi:sugar fermentation stimulation protein A